MWSCAPRSLSPWITRAWLGVWLVWLAGCANPMFSAPPGIWVVVDAEPELGVQLERIELSTDRDGATLWLKDPPPGERHGSLPLVHDLRWESGRYRDALHVRGYSGETLLVERSLDLRFNSDERRVVHVFLTRACADLVGVCEPMGSTCVDCGGVCESDHLPDSAFVSVELSTNPLTGYQRPVCTSSAMGVPDTSDEVDAAQAGDATDGESASRERDAGNDAAAMRDADSADAGSPLDASSVADAAPLETSIAPAPEASAPDASTSLLLRDCVLLLHMDEAQWSGAAGEVKDVSGLRNHGSAVGGAQVTESGRFGHAAQLNGANWITVPDAPSLRPSSALTVSAWFYLDQPLTTWPGIVAKRIGYLMDSTFALFLSPEARVYVDLAGEDTRFFSNGTVSAGQWHHVAFTFDGTAAPAERVRLYLDGALDRSAPETTASIPAFTGDVMIGNLNNGGDVLAGRVDEVGMWMRVLTPSEISSLASVAAQ